MAKGKKGKTLKVKSTDGRVFWERHPDHPDGEVFVADDAVVKVARTSQVSQAIRLGRLEEVTGKDTPTPGPCPASPSASSGQAEKGSKPAGKSKAGGKGKAKASGKSQSKKGA